MDEQERYDLIVKIADQLEWLSVHHQSFTNQDLEKRIGGLYRLLDQVDPTKIISLSGSRIERIVQERRLRV